MKCVPLAGGKTAIVDDEDFEKVTRFKWYTVTCPINGGTIFYAARRKSVNGTRRIVLMHRYILGLLPGMITDHKNGDGLDNRRENIRVATNGQNKANARKQIGCTSKYKGVYWYRVSSKWHSRINFNGQTIHLGYFDSEQDAGAAYDRAALARFGEFARTNFPT